jgi:hypothetical protein
LTVANGKVRIEGGIPEQMFIPRILQGIGVQVESPFAQKN